MGIKHYKKLCQWFKIGPDLSSGEDHAPKSELIIGPVNSTHNQSSYQCFFDFFEILQSTVTSGIGTITVLGK